MSIIVQKFGGTSVADSTKIKNVAKAVTREYDKGHQVVVVVSAMGHTTDYLVSLAGEITSKPCSREMDMLLSSGEQVSIALLAMAIQEAGYPAISLVAGQVGIITEKVHSKARILDIKPDKMQGYLNEGKIVIVAGFQGVTPDNEITTLGRGGSDTSAVALAATLKAERCDIYTDVDGVYSADPRIIEKPSKLNQISYMEMLELARVGANVLHPRSVETAKQFNVPMRVRSSFNHDDLGTLIIGENLMEIYKPVSGVAADLSQVRLAILKVPDAPGTAAKVFTSLAEHNISVDMIIQSLKEDNSNNIAFTVSESDLDQTLNILERVKQEINAADIVVDKNIAKVSIVGAGMIDKPGIAADMFSSLADASINIKMISTSEIKISCIVEKDRAHDAVKAIHTKFHLDEEGIEIPEISL
ncbi:MAG: aspartate kinase [Candidatus Melainabacteria bacterium RIFOXYA12_FULL_32_12]|nr:MAG: aspartate kinase [Candidatus Melainabacteria bacterium RIFOXYA2_FULL_32_9]OGI31173.1 MAG: aspartate kinase [Candidatus Melainabacteria bacterium RIFOXYA12_FULL_32_12]